MKTENLIQMIASDSLRDLRPSFKSHLLKLIFIGGLVSFTLMVLIFNFRPDFFQALKLPFFWIKLSFPLVLLVVAFQQIIQLAKPGNPKLNFFWELIVPILIIWTLAILSIMSPDSQDLERLINRKSGQACALAVVALSLPIFVVILWVLRDMAATRPRLIGFMAGLFSGGFAACIFSLSCTEMSPVYIGIWYLIGMLIPAFIGALVGKQLLKW
jgi:hypothetical protein